MIRRNFVKKLGMLGIIGSLLPSILLAKSKLNEKDIKEFSFTAL